MIRRVYLEAHIAIHPSIWLLPALFAILRLTGVIWVDGWLPMLESVYPILYPLVVISLLEQERRRRTAEVLVSTPGSKAAVLTIRLILILVPLIGIATAAVPPGDWLSILPAGILLSGVALLLGLFFGAEIGLAISLGWWGLSFAAALGAPHILANPIATWLLLIHGSSPISHNAFIIRKIAHLSAGLLLLVGCTAIYGRHYWRGFAH